MIDRGADDRQAERGIDRVVKADVLEHRQALVVIHRQHRVGIGEHMRGEQRVRRVGAAKANARGAQLVERRNDDVEFLAPEKAVFAGVRIEAANLD